MPNTNIYFCGNIPINSRNQIDFGSSGGQLSYFTSKAVHTMTNATHQRLNFPIRCDAKPDKLANANYVVFSNGSKYYYCRITEVEYKNDNCSWVKFEIDGFQTYQFDMKISGAYVEREMLTGDNVIPPPFNKYLYEDLGAGEIHVHRIQNEYFASDKIGIVVGLTDDIVDYGTPSFSFPWEPSDISVSIGGKINNVYSGARYYCIKSDADRKMFNQLVNSYIKDIGKSPIISMHLYPPDLMNDSGMIDSYSANEKIDIEFTKSFSSVGRYSNVKNGKLFSYPYNFTMMSNNSGSQKILYNEKFANPLAQTYVIKGNILSGGKAFCYPKNYGGRLDNYDEGLTVFDNPPIQWTSDSYLAYLGQRSGEMEKGLVVATAGGAIAGGMKGGQTGALVGGMAGFMGYTVNEFANEAVQAYKQHTDVNGSANNDVLNVTMGNVGVDLMDCVCNEGTAKAIDDYFSAFGYLTKQTKVPNVRTRPFWNFVKCGWCNVNGNFPLKYLNEIENLFNNGVTFWHVDAGAIVGDYSMDNRG